MQVRLSGSWVVWILRLLFPLRLVLATLLLLAASGLLLWLEAGPEFLKTGPSQLVHSALGWFGIVAFLSYGCHCWARVREGKARPPGALHLGFTTSILLALATGLLLFFGGGGDPSGCFRQVHLASTVALLVFLVPVVLSANYRGNGD